MRNPRQTNRSNHQRGGPVKKAPPRTRRRATRAINLSHFKSLLVNMRDETVSELDSLSESLMPEVVAVGEQPEEVTGSVQTVLMIDRQRKLLNALETALLKIDNGEYGTCAICGGQIEQGRLEAIPYTQQCMRCGTT